MVDDTETWWTVPQAAVWIRTRDLAAVRGLSPEARTHLEAAEAAVPGARAAAIVYLLNACKHGRVLPRGWLLGTATSGMGAPVHSPFWLDDASLVDDDAAGVLAIGKHATIERLTLAAAEVTEHWRSPEKLLVRGPIGLRLAVGLLGDDDCAAWFLSHPAVTVTGLTDGAGTPIIIARRVLAGGFDVDPETDRLTAGPLHWLGVKVGVASNDDRPALNGMHTLPSRRTAARVNRMAAREKTKALIVELYGPIEKIDPNISAPSVARRLQAEKGHAAMADTIRRILNRK